MAICSRSFARICWRGAGRSSEGAQQEKSQTTEDAKDTSDETWSSLPAGVPVCGREAQGQTRKASTIPYIAHLMGVASLVLEAGGDEDLAIAALLHDVVEDCGGAPMLKEVRRRFGSARRQGRRRLHRCRYVSQAAVARAQGEIHRHLKTDGRRYAPGFGRRQAEQRALHPQRLPRHRRICLVTVQRWTRGHSLVLSDFAGCISPAQARIASPGTWSLR